MHNPITIKHTNVIPTNIDHIPSNTVHSGSSAMLYVFEDNEAEIKMMIQGRIPTMRHVPRTHRVALDWLFDRNNFDQKIPIRYIDTKHQLADILTKGNFTRDEWNNLLHLFNISHFSSTCCTKNFSSKSCSTMAKRIQDQKEEERVVSKSRPAAMNLSSSIATSSSTASSPLASKSPGILTASVKPDSRMSINPSSFDAASTYEVRLKDAYFGGSMEKQRRKTSHQEEEDSEDSDNPEAEIWYYKGKQVAEKPIAQNSKAWGQPLAHGASSSVDKESQKDTEATWKHYLHISPDTSHYMEAVFSTIREIYGRRPGDPMKDLDVNLAIWGMFTNTPLRAAVHLGNDHDVNLRYVKNHLWKTAGLLFRQIRKAGQWSDRNRWHKRH